MRNRLLKKPVIILTALSLALIPSSLLALQLQFSPAPGGLRLGAGATGKSSIYKTCWIDLNKDGRMNPYEDPSQPVEKRVEDLLARMTFEEKIGQGLGPTGGCPSRTGAEDKALIAKGMRGSYSVVPECELRNGLQRLAVEHSRLGIPLAFGCDAVHGGGYSLPLSEPSSLSQLVGLRVFKKSPPEALDDAVRRILRAKFTSGLFDKPYIRSKSGSGPGGQVV